MVIFKSITNLFRNIHRKYLINYSDEIIFEKFLYKLNKSQIFTLFYRTKKYPPFKHEKKNIKNAVGVQIRTFKTQILKTILSSLK
jgi:hypothetical protein